MSQLRITVPGKPVAKQRARRGAAGRWYTPERTRAYEELVAWHCRAAGSTFGSSSVRVRIDLWTSGRLRGDLDNYAKSILDGMVIGGVLDDDRQLVELDVRVVAGFGTAEEKAVITIARQTETGVETVDREE